MGYSITGGTLQRDKSPVTQISSSFVGGRFRQSPKIVVIHFTGGGSARSSAEWFRSPQNAGSSAHVVIDRDGSVIQCVSFDKIAWHAGKSRWGALVGLNQYSYGVELANWGDLKSSGSEWSSHTGLRISDPFIATHRNGNPDGSPGPIGWEPYPEAQLSTATALMQLLVEGFGVKEVVGHDDIAPTRKWDPGPAFDMLRFRTRVFGDRRDNSDNLIEVRAVEGLNLRAGPGMQFAAIESLANGTPLQPSAREGRWIEVTVLGLAGQPRATGWVHSTFVGD